MAFVWTIHSKTEWFQLEAFLLSLARPEDIIPALTYEVGKEYDFYLSQCQSKRAQDES